MLSFEYSLNDVEKRDGPKINNKSKSKNICYIIFIFSLLFLILFLLILLLIIKEDLKKEINERNNKNSEFKSSIDNLS